MSLRGPTPLTVVQLSGDQVQGVIHTAQTSSVIHSPQGQSVQVTVNFLEAKWSDTSKLCFVI